MTAWTVPGIGRLVERLLAEIVGLRLDFRAMFHESEGVVDRWVPPSPRPTPALMTAPVRLPAGVGDGTRRRGRATSGSFVSRTASGR